MAVVKSPKNTKKKFLWIKNYKKKLIKNLIIFKLYKPHRKQRVTGCELNKSKRLLKMSIDKFIFLKFKK